jgi:hypothetical protein
MTCFVRTNHSRNLMPALRPIVIIFLSLLIGGAEGTEAMRTRSPVGPQVEIREVRNVGVSAARETHSIIQISWSTGEGPDVKIVSFDLLLEVTYADGFIEKATAKMQPGTRDNRFEVPSVHRSPNKPAAEMKSFKVTITASYSETTTKQVSL